MHLIWPPKAIMIVLNWATHLASRAICLVLAVGVAACGPAPRELEDPIFEFSRECNVAQSRLKLHKVVGITKLYSLDNHGLDYLAVQGDDGCGVKFRHYSLSSGDKPVMYSNSTTRDIRFPRVEIDGQVLAPFGSREFMLGYSNNFLAQCEGQQNPRSACVNDLGRAAKDAINIHISPKNFLTAASRTVVIINGSAFYSGGLLL